MTDELKVQPARVLLTRERDRSHAHRAQVVVAIPRDPDLDLSRRGS